MFVRLAVPVPEFVQLAAFAPVQLFVLGQQFAAVPVPVLFPKSYQIPLQTLSFFLRPWQRLKFQKDVLQ